MLNKILAGIFVITALVALQILVFIKGWGMHPQNWWWIIGGGIFGQLFLKFIGDKAMKDAA